MRRGVSTRSIGRGGLAALLVALLPPAPGLAETCNESFAAIFKEVSPAVVSIQATQIDKARPRPRVQTVSGSGVVIGRNGQILTNAHVVDGAAMLSVTLDSGVKVRAHIMGLDSVLDLALIQIEATSPLTPARLGDSSALRVGDEVATIGSPLGLAQTMTQGIVSGLNRIRPGLTDEPMIQTDAPINHGSSGGPLVDRCGQVIGINTSFSDEAQLIAFAVPIDDAKAVLRDLREEGHVIRPWLGMEGRDIDSRLSSVIKLPLTTGYLVEVVDADSPAEHEGVRGGTIPVVVQGEEYLLGGDIVTAIQGVPIRTRQDYIARVRALRPGERVRVTIVHDGQTRELTLTVGERPRLPADLVE
jgi:serine protease Do